MNPEDVATTGYNNASPGLSSAQLAEKSVFDNVGLPAAAPQQSVAVQQQPVQAPATTPAQNDTTAAVIASMEAKGLHPATVQSMKEKAGLVQNSQTGGDGPDAGQLVQKTQTDPVVLLQPYTQPADFTAQYPQPLDPTEILDDCEEINVWRALPEKVTPFNADQWREMTSIDFATATGLTNDGFFEKGGCPDRLTASGANQTVTRMFNGVSQTLSFEDIQHSAAVASIQGLGISRLLTHTVGGPDVIDVVRDAKAKEIKKQEILVLNNLDLAFVKGDSSVNSLGFDGIETQVTAANSARVNTDATGTFDIEEFDNFVTAGCARPTHIFGHPMALSQIKKGYLALGAVNGTEPVQQVVMQQANGQVIAGLTLADQVHTSAGTLTMVPDFRFTTTQVADHAFDSSVYLLRMRHNGEDIVYKSTQTPLVFKDLAPGCTAISFMVYTVTALVVKHMCAQAVWTSQFSGIVGEGCEIVAGTAIGNS